MKKIVIITFLLIGFFSIAQTGIGTTTPDASAKLDVFSTDKGFLPPRVALTAINSASPIANPANGLMVFNTVTAGANPNQVVPGYYYWDATGLKWVSLSTTVGNVQNQAVFRSTSNTSANGTAINSWNSRFNNIALGDLTVTSNTTFALSNGIYKLEWALPYQQSSTYNLIQLQEFQSASWNTFLNDGGFANIGNGGNAEWGGGTFAADVVDCSSSTRTFRMINADGFRVLYYGATLIITKLNPSITTSTTADNLGNHTATKNLQLSGNYISNDGGNEGIRLDNNGNVGIGTNAPAVPLDVNGAVNASTLSLSNTTSTPSLTLRNGDAAAAFNDNAQIRMGWAGSTAGTSQYAQMIHTRHNAGTAENAIDFYLSNGTSNNTITSGSTRAMSITSPGNVEVSGKLTIGDPSGNVSTKLVGRVTAGTFLTFDNLKFSVTTSGQRGLSIATVSGTVNLFVEGRYNNGAVYGTRTDTAITYTTTPSSSPFGWGFNSSGDTIVYHLIDSDNGRLYRVTLIIMPSYINNFISVERLL